MFFFLQMDYITIEGLSEVVRNQVNDKGTTKITKGLNMLKEATGKERKHKYASYY